MMRNVPWWSWSLLLCLWWVGTGCGDDGTQGPSADVADADDAQPDGTVPDLPEEGDLSPDLPGDPEVDTQDIPSESTDEEPGEYLGLEPTGSESEWPDCISGCAHAHPLAPVIEIMDLPFDALLGYIDGEEHTYSIDGVEYIGPDVDLIAVRVPGRTMIEITVEPADPGSLIRPLVITHDGFSYMTFNAGLAEDDVTARTVVAAPYVAELPFFLVFEDATNYQNWGVGPYVGGDDYGYLVRFNFWDFAPIELGELSESNSPLEVNGALIERAGDIHYYRFSAPATDVAERMPRVEFTRTGSEDFVGFLSGMKTIGGDLVWNLGGWVWDEDHDGQLTLPGSAFQVCGPTVCTGLGEYIFVVMDWNGSAFPGSFSYDLDIVLP